LAAITPARHMLTSLTYLQFSDTRDFEGAKECTWFSVDKYCFAGSSFYCGSQPCFGRTGKEILASLEYQGFDKSPDQVGPRALALVYWFVLFKLISILRMYMMAKFSPRK